MTDNEEPLDIKKLIHETRIMADAAEKSAAAAREEARDSMRRADATWKLVMTMRNEANHSWWGRLLPKR